MSSQTPAAVRDYLARMRTALSDLPDAEVEEIVDDVRPHLAEIGAELGENARLDQLVERLGAPESYAAELRAAGDYPAPDAPERRAAGRSLPRLVVWSFAFALVGTAAAGYLIALELTDDHLLALFVLAPVIIASGAYVLRHGLRPVESLPEIRWARSLASADDRGVVGYLRSLVPAWWLLCALALVVLAVLLLVKSITLLVLPVFLVVGVAMLWLGPKSTKDRKLLWISLPVSAFALGALAGMAGHLVEAVDRADLYTDRYATAGYVDNGLLYRGQPVENVYLFDAEGKPLTDVYLYDQDGRPILLPRYGCDPVGGGQVPQGEDNRFPRPYLDHGALDDQGNRNGYNGYRPYCREVDEVPFTVAVPKPPAGK
ncbi:Uncharacterized membrane protein [Amycolatopsis arida]|uniref:Uncharacterized membrane protein n=1 Tax=Amycolatopsis arida TaxID=587909 RepID=A0A1I5K929_9PSEU|nr:hypothetical protein [Amycolatopsis arida]TDX96930.1 putative membrane protein [Amycolatopsis arida]SFO81233.1 Uncharacterized membrane protein [Amycolatopsis arida]